MVLPGSCACGHGHQRKDDDGQFAWAHVPTGRRKTFVGGNTGYPFSNFAASARPRDLVVLEVSSFQLDHIAGFRPWIAVMLNITPDHMDRYDHDFDAYARSKFRLGENQGNDDWFVCNRDDREVRERTSAFRSSRTNGPALLEYSRMGEVGAGAFVRDEEIVLRITDEEILMRSEELVLSGPHNLHNALAAAVAARVAGLPPAVVREGLRTFMGVPHRMELVRETGGIRYVNDSKATNVHAVQYALESVDDPVVLIAGGRDKGNDYGPIKLLVKQKVRGRDCRGESAGKVAEELGIGSRLRYRCPFVRRCGVPGQHSRRSRDVVLLSPACASFDMFRSYEERGDTFRNLVNDCSMAFSATALPGSESRPRRPLDRYIVWPCSCWRCLAWWPCTARFRFSQRREPGGIRNVFWCVTLCASAWRLAPCLFAA